MKEPRHPFHIIVERIFGPEQPPDYSKWQQIGTLTPEEVTRKRGIEQKTHLADREINLYAKKVNRIHAEIEEIRDAWWNDLYRSHSLPKARYTITDDGRILMEPKQSKEATNGKTTQ